ncbi:MAG: alcohol dehydrogenase catalytic domain-containing protein [Defluviitaleaceae bacterium]|nr:alcohol dehydrogenase catalytic domain-containing protein [Defluviitaleaceae bacterium]
MQALQYTAPYKLDLINKEKPSPKAGEVLLKVLYSGICGSDVHGYFGTNGRRTAPMVMGHEFSAEVEGLGAGCKKLKCGDIVTVQPCIACFECSLCKSGRTNLCGNRTFLGVFDVDGAMQEYICVPERQCFVLPKGMDSKVGSLIEAFAVSYAAVKKAKLVDGKNVLIIGGGAIGLLALAACKMLNLPSLKVAVCDLSQNRLEIAKKLGADVVINPGEGDFDQELINAFGKKADITIEAVGIAQTARQSLAALEPGGTSIWIGNNHKDVNINMQEIVTRELNVMGSYIYTHDEFGECIDAIVKSGFDMNVFISKIIAPDEAPKMFDVLSKDTEKYLKCIIGFGG